MEQFLTKVVPENLLGEGLEGVSYFELLTRGNGERGPARPTARKSLSAEGAIGELARRVISTSQQEHGYSMHGTSKLGSTATTRRVKE